MPEMHSSPRRAASLLSLTATVVVLAGCLEPVALPVGSAIGSGGGSPVSIGSAGPTPTVSFSRPTPGPGPTFLAYMVKSGDTLTSIARAHDTTPRSIAFWSRSAYPSLDPESTSYDPDRLKIGWVLSIVPGQVFDEDELFDATPTPSAQPSPS